MAVLCSLLAARPLPARALSTPAGRAGLCRRASTLAQIGSNAAPRHPLGYSGRWSSATATTKASSSSNDMELSDGCVGAPLEPGTKLPLRGDESIMSQKAHGTTDKAVQSNLRWGCDQKVADKICSFNRHYAEYSGYWTSTSFLTQVNKDEVTTYYDSVTGLPLFRAPVGRTFEEFKKESMSHGWPSFRDEEVIWDHVRVLPDGEAVSTAGTHLGHNLPDRSGNRYCINLVSVAGRPEEQ